MIIYNKLVRDNIPDIIIQDGKRSIFRILEDEEYKEYLDKKLSEEVNEYFNCGKIEELADIVEVIHAILKSRDISNVEFNQIRYMKARKNGFFKEKILLERVEDINE